MQTRAIKIINVGSEQWKLVAFSGYAVFLTITAIMGHLPE